MNPKHPISGCSHGSAVDPKLQGLTKREWLIGQALPGIISMATTADAVDTVFEVVDAIIKRLKAEEDKAAIDSPPPVVDPLPAPLTPDQM